MLNYFCSKCGGKNLYQFQKPKFCSHCGLSFLSATVPNTSVIKPNQFEANVSSSKNFNKNIDTLDTEEDSSYSQDYSSMRRLDVSIEKYNQNDGVRLEDLVSDEKPQKQLKARKKILKNKNVRKKVAKSLPESFVSEAKMSGRNYNNSLQLEDDEI